ncbi:hypothetical protein Dimus_038996 [Dionaea muscipula]
MEPGRRAGLMELPGPQPRKLRVATNILTTSDLENINVAFPCPPEYEYSLPLEAQTAADGHAQNALAIHLDHWKNGLRFPLHPFFVAVFQAYRVLPAQLTPELIGYITSFIVRSAWFDMAPSLLVFNECHESTPEPGRTGYYQFKVLEGCKLVTTTGSPKLWKQKFILVEGGVFPISTLLRTP